VGCGPCLLHHPEQLRLLRQDQGLMLGAVEEALRYESPISRQPRRVRQEVEMGGCQMREAEIIMLMLGERTGTRCNSTIWTGSISGGRTTATWLLGWGSTSVSAHRWPGWGDRSRLGRFCGGCQTRS
jgi:hypothetical protein